MTGCKGLCALSKSLPHATADAMSPHSTGVQLSNCNSAIVIANTSALQQPCQLRSTEVECSANYLVSYIALSMHVSISPCCPACSALANICLIGQTYLTSCSLKSTHKANLPQVSAICKNAFRHWSVFLLVRLVNESGRKREKIMIRTRRHESRESSR